LTASPAMKASPSGSWTMIRSGGSVEPCQPGRGQTKNPARGGQQEGQPEGDSHMGDRKQRREKPLEPRKAPCAVPARHEEHHYGKGHHGHTEPGHKRQADRFPNTGCCEQGPPGLQTGRMAAKRGEIAEGRQHRADQSRRHGPKQQDQRQRGNPAQGRRVVSRQSAPPPLPGGEGRGEVGVANGCQVGVAS